eukprot:TRINITY_DN12964_c0_g1_i5.p1 TRINITY_DN12964_c0_g1~~TRINITY_DN12964_c0_g1_i5.p1  ORF type:complete len:197 (-),score=42.67 TRINITY_DN12964_c0_g1_i5:123-638(-)
MACKSFHFALLSLMLTIAASEDDGSTGGFLAQQQQTPEDSAFVSLYPSSSDPDADLTALDLNSTEVIELAAASSSSGGCYSGIVGKAYKFAPSCFRSCPQLCGPVGAALTAYLTRGGMRALWPVLCHYRHQYHCGISRSNYRKCAPLLRKAAGFGVVLPRSDRSLNAHCHR